MDLSEVTWEYKLHKAFYLIKWPKYNTPGNTSPLAFAKKCSVVLHGNGELSQTSENTDNI